jgi:hypothetical protein
MQAGGRARCSRRLSNKTVAPAIPNPDRSLVKGCRLDLSLVRPGSQSRKGRNKLAQRGSGGNDSGFGPEPR